MRIVEIFDNIDNINKIQNKLPELFKIAEIESSRAGKIGMEVGSLRERILVSFFIYKYGIENVETEIPITEAETDFILFKHPISIKTITGNSLSGIKLIWTVDPDVAYNFKNNYKPKCDIILIQINWNRTGHLFYIPLEVQEDVLKKFGKDEYIKLPKKGTNPRGVEFQKQAMIELTSHPNTKKIEILWKIDNIDYNPFLKWVDLWKED